MEKKAVHDQIELKGECDISKTDISVVKPVSFISPISNKRLNRNDLDFGVSGMVGR